MTKAIALLRTHAAPLDTMRALVVCGCALTLAFAGPVLPF